MFGGGGGEPSMNTVPTYRHGRKYYTPGPNDRGGCAGVCSVLVTLILLTIPPVFFIGSEALRYKTYVTLTSALESGIQPLSGEKSNTNIGDIVHATTSKIETTASDPDMSLYVPGALALRRKTEYCQWQELRRENCRTCTRTVTAKDGTSKEESYKCDCVTSFDYVKTWRSHRINSLVFDQPAAHNNPQRDPLPSITLPAPSAMIEVEDNESGKGIIKATLQSGMLSNVRATWRKINFVHGGVPPPPSWFASFFVKWIPDKTRYEDTAALSNIGKSLGATKYNFVYVGQGGYFFSPYQEDKYATLFKYFMEYVEDSLFDWQVGDLMPSCTAGDVRFYYEVVDPAVISIVGEVKEPVKAEKGRVQIGPWQTEDAGGMTLGLVHAGEVDAETMIAVEDSDSLWKTLLPRFVLLIWSIAMSRLLGALFGTGIAESQFITQLSATIGLWFGIVGIVWYVYWGKSMDGTFMLLGSVVLMTLAFQQAPKSNGGFRAMWNMIGRWANVPPSWRVEDTYADEKNVVVGEVGYEADPKKKVP